MDLRIRAETVEKRVLAPYATLSAASAGREHAEAECDIRTAFQRDRDRILHSKAFRRLKRKTQVFMAPEGDHYRTRLTHTLEVSQIARTIARALRLNEDLVEAIALGHDLGHTPYGHAGEMALAAAHIGGFRHNQQSRRIVEELETRSEAYRGLNLTQEVRDGISQHPWGECRPATPEGVVVRVADRIAYVNHDIDDAIRGGLIAAGDLPREAVRALGDRTGLRIDSMVRDVVSTSADTPDICMSDEGLRAMTVLREFLFERVYVGSMAKTEEVKAAGVVRALYGLYTTDPSVLARELGADLPPTALPQAACDYIAGMTDDFATSAYVRAFVPSAWALRL